MFRSIRTVPAPDATAGEHPSGSQLDGSAPASQSSHLLQAQRLTHRVGHKHVVDQVSVSVSPGSIHALLGPSGAGKSTFIAMLLGRIRPTAGHIHVFRHAVAPFDTGVPPGMAGVLAGARFHADLTGRANLEILQRHATTRHRPPGALTADAWVDALLDQVGLARCADDPVDQYSPGMRHRLTLATALLRRPRLLILDEPPDGYTPQEVQTIAPLLRQLRDDGGSVLLSSRNPDNIEHLCDHVTVLRAGRVAYDGSLAQLRCHAVPMVVDLATREHERALTLAHTVRGVDARLTWAGHQPGSPTDACGVTVTACEAALDRFLLRLGAAGVETASIRVRRTSVHAAYLWLTSPVEITPNEPVG